MTTPRARTLRLLALSAASLALLAGCSRHTALSVYADLVPFLGTASTQATVPYTAGTTTLDLPPDSSQPTAGALVDLSGLGVPADAIQNVDELGLDLTVAVRPDSAVDAGSATLFVAPSGETDIFQAPYAAGRIDVPALPANQSSTVTGSFLLDAQHHPAALARVQSGSFRIGVQLQASAATGGQAQIDLQHLVVSVALPPGWGLP